MAFCSSTVNSAPTLPMTVNHPRSDSCHRDLLTLQHSSNERATCVWLLHHGFCDPSKTSHGASDSGDDAANEEPWMGEQLHCVFTIPEPVPPHKVQSLLDPRLVETDRQIKHMSAPLHSIFDRHLRQRLPDPFHHLIRPLLDDLAPKMLARHPPLPAEQDKTRLTRSSSLP